MINIELLLNRLCFYFIRRMKRGREHRGAAPY